MENSPISEQPLNNLTPADLEILITQIVKKVIKQETQKQQINITISPDSYTLPTPSQDLLNTFGSWEDNRNAEEIIDDIYASRTVGE
ncbi:hypothetical protein [Calothrix sp. 336/3]|uniref:hypothetical protein n=1 Tax=Calothrix sp. 336/3 TaxID=1337936 RepID=UPI0004E2EA56|nr:hypothetical protein [Calothrix sp. 336/3]AKG21645.1 hypothetical protein IJ00_10545 [Calothrix sp. 336/3]